MSQVLEWRERLETAHKLLHDSMTELITKKNYSEAERGLHVVDQLMLDLIEDMGGTVVSHGRNDHYYCDARRSGLHSATSGGLRVLQLRTPLLGRRLRACRLLGRIRIRLAVGKVGRLNSFGSGSY